jgi:hypothetical protein
MESARLEFAEQSRFAGTGATGYNYQSCRRLDHAILPLLRSLVI